MPYNLIRSSTAQLLEKLLKTLLSFSLLALATLSMSNTYAHLPKPIYNALRQAHLAPENISLVILPINYDITKHQVEKNSNSNINNNDSNDGNDKNLSKSHLPPAILPKSPLDPKAYIKRHIQSNIATTLLSAIHSENTNNEKSNYSTKVTSNSIAMGRDTGMQNTPPIFVEPHLQSVQRSNIASLTVPILHYASIPRTPASTMKLIPTFIALDKLGSNFTWHTKAYHTGFIANHTLHGDLIIEGSGDPKLTHQRLAELLAQVQKIGVHHITGNIILDTSIFQHVGKDPAQFDNDPLRPYNASPDGLLVNFSTIEITTAPLANGQALLSYTPRLADYDLPLTIGQRRTRCRKLRQNLAPSWQNKQLILHKRLPSACGYRTFYVAHPDVKEFARQVVKQKWYSLGNTLSGQVISIEQPNLTPVHTYAANQNKSLPKLNNTINSVYQQPTTILAASPVATTSVASQPLKELIYDINHYSNNVMTEQLMLSSTAYTTSPQKGATDYTSTVKDLKKWWRSHLKTPPPNMTNGSGLCRTCTVTAENLADILSFAYQHPEFDAYVNSMGIAGVSGTIVGHKWRKPNSQAIGRAWIKTGTIDTVTAMAGYVKGRSEQDYVVVAIINTPYKLNATKARRVLDTMLDWTAKH